MDSSPLTKLVQSEKRRQRIVLIIQEAAFKILGMRIPERVITLKNNTLSLELDSLKRTEVALKRNLLLSEVNKHLDEINEARLK